MSIKHNLEIVRDKIEQSVLLVNKKSNDIKLVVVTKTVGIEEIKESIESGAIDIGENRIQEAEKKIQIIGNNNISWHLIGHLQTNKTKKAVKYFDLIHSVDNMHVFEAINRHAVELDKVQDILVQVNVCGEETKYGFTPEEIHSFFDEIKNRDIRNITIKGFMTMAPFCDNEKILRDCFRKTRELFVELKEKYGDLSFVDMKYLSMGMSNDYQIAIEEGANIVRVGSAIFRS
ncbi:YggS family pyridoxal phosphate-dependent enzyme [bacterium]